LGNQIILNCKGRWLPEDFLLFSGGAALTHLSLNAITEGSHGTGYSSALGVVKSTRNNLLLHSTGMQHLSKVLPRLEEADFSGQCEIGLEGWGFFIQSLKKCQDDGIQRKLKKLRLHGCKMKEETRALLIDGTNIYHSSLEIDFGDDSDEISVSGRASWFKRLICSNGDNN